MEITLAIVGTAGRKDDERKVSLPLYKSMCIVAQSLIKQLNESNYPITHLVSGGAAWADHVAVSLFNEEKIPNLRLFLPCDFDNNKFLDDSSGVRGFSLPGETLNFYHSNFYRKTNINSLSDIQIAKHKGAELHKCRGGFHGRNSMVAKSDFILAMTFGDGNMVKEGGTADTIRKYLKRVGDDGSFNKAFHYNLNDGKIYRITSAPIKNSNSNVLDLFMP
jgi:hypothetical protein